MYYKSSAQCQPSLVKTTYHSQRPEDTVVDQHPCLLSEPCLLLFLAKSDKLRQRGQEVVHHYRPQTSDDNDPKSDKARVIPSQGVVSRRWVIIGERKEFPSVMSCTIKAHVRHCQEGQEI